MTDEVVQATYRSGFDLIYTSKEDAKGYQLSDISYGNDGSDTIPSVTPGVKYFAGEDDVIYADSLYVNNKVGLPNLYGNNFASTFRNEFLTISSEDFSAEETDEGYALSTAKAAAIVTLLMTEWGNQINSSRTAVSSYASSDEGTFNRIYVTYSDDMKTTSGSVYTLGVDIKFFALGDEVILSRDEVAMAEDDGTDKTALTAALAKMGNNMTVTYSCQENDDYMYEDSSTSRYFYDGTSIFAQGDIEDETIPDNGDLLFYPEKTNPALLDRVVYDYSEEAFDPDGYNSMSYTPMPYSSQIPALAQLSTAFFSAQDDGTYLAQSEYNSLLMPYLQPYNERRALFTEGAAKSRDFHRRRWLSGSRPQI